MAGNKTITKIVRESEPINLECPFDSLSGEITPCDAFYIRNHFPEPKADLKTWRLSIEGAVSKPFQLSYEELLALPSQSVTALLECAGNSRVHLVPKVEGAQWGLGAIGNAQWRGVSLSAVLQRAGLKDNAIDIIFEGADQGIPPEKPKPREPINYSRSIPRGKASDPSILLAYEMNGEPLTLSHGFPLRLIVPGWYGMASVKWLQRIVVTDYPFDGYYQKIDYAFWVERNGVPVREPITEMELKSQVAQPSSHEFLQTDITYRVHGAAWTGANKIAKVEISVDGGKDWQLAELTANDNPYTWSFWQFEWRTPNTAQDCVLMSRATDTAGRTQSMERDLKRDTYRISHVLPIPVHIR